MNKKINLISCAISVASIAGASADELKPPLFVLPVDISSPVTSVSTSMHDAGSAPSSYSVLGNGGGSSSVQTTTGSSASGGGSGAAAYEQDSSGGSSYTTSRPSSGDSRRSGSGARYSGGSGSTSGGTASVGSGYDSRTSAKGGIPIHNPQPSPLTFSVSAGYQSDYVYHGLSQITNAVFGASGPFGMYYVGVGAQYKGLSLGVKYVRSEDSNLNPRFHPTVTKTESYTELVFDINYTLGLIAGSQGAGNWLDLTVGYQLLSFGEDTFWNTGEQHEYYAKLSMNRYQWIRPSISYHDIDQGSALKSGTTTPGAKILNGELLIVQVEGSGVVHDTGKVQFGVGYYAQIGYDDGYNGGSTTFNRDWYQYGLNFPVSIGDLTITPSVHYTDRPDGGVSDNIWWGIGANFTF